MHQQKTNYMPTFSLTEDPKSRKENEYIILLHPLRAQEQNSLLGQLCFNQDPLNTVGKDS